MQSNGRGTRRTRGDGLFNFSGKVNFLFLVKKEELYPRGLTASSHFFLPAVTCGAYHHGVVPRQRHRWVGARAALDSGKTITTRGGHPRTDDSGPSESAPRAPMSLPEGHFWQ